MVGLVISPWSKSAWPGIANESEWCVNIPYTAIDTRHFKVTKEGKVTYLPHKALAEVSKDKEPIGRECAEFNWFESQLMSDSNELRVK